MTTLLNAPSPWVRQPAGAATRLVHRDNAESGAGSPTTIGGVCRSGSVDNAAGSADPSCIMDDGRTASQTGAMTTLGARNEITRIPKTWGVTVPVDVDELLR